MKLYNHTAYPKYCRFSKSRLMPGVSTRELPDLRDAIGEVLSHTQGLSLVLSDEDIACLEGVLSRHRSQSSGRAPDSAAADPLGEKAIAEERARAKKAKDDAAAAEISEAREREARIDAESRRVSDFEDNVNEARGLASAVVPELLGDDEVPESLASIKSHNAAIASEGRKKRGRKKE